MKIKKVAIVHFQPLEKYPPVMNLINELSREKDLICCVYSTKNTKINWFNAKNIKIDRIAKIDRNAFLRYWCYVKFNVVTFAKLLFNPPQIIIAFESYSVLPTYLFTKLFKKSVSFIHYHEYISLKEITASSGYSRFLNLIEKKLYKNCNFISQTNEQRADLFLENFSFVDARKMLISPNFPPKSWYEFALKNKRREKRSTVKMVHVGALSLDTMYTKEIIDWVITQQGKFTIDFYTDNITKSAKDYFDRLNSDNIKLLAGINYFNLPQILIKYDIGLTLYNGHIPNYVFNVPNKVLEYLACGLNVLYSNDLISTTIFVDKYLLQGCYATDFVNFDDRLMQVVESNKEFNPNHSYCNLISTKKTITSKILEV